MDSKIQVVDSMLGGHEFAQTIEYVVGFFIGQF